jgi:hypothetical protein
MNLPMVTLEKLFDFATLKAADDFQSGDSEIVNMLAPYS